MSLEITKGILESILDDSSAGWLFNKMTISTSDRSNEEMMHFGCSTSWFSTIWRGATPLFSLWKYFYSPKKIWVNFLRRKFLAQFWQISVKKLKPAKKNQFPSQRSKFFFLLKSQIFFEQLHRRWAFVRSKNRGSHLRLSWVSWL